MTELSLPNIREQELPPSLDARFLRVEARNYIEQLAGEHWTDYNTHDPGITILEVLAYAITDLGLRSSLDIKKLTAGKETGPLFSPLEILPSAPYSLTDYQRLLLQHPHLQNVWIESKEEVGKGLYQVLLDLKPFSVDPSSTDAELIDPNEIWLRGERPVEINNRFFDYYVVFPHWEEFPNLELWEKGADLTAVEIHRIVPFDDSEKNHFIQYHLEISFFFNQENDQQLEERMELRLRLPKGIPKVRLEEGEDRETPNDTFIAEVRQSLTPRFFKAHQEKAAKRKEVLKQFSQFLRRHRNLGEDWGEVSTIRIQQIGLQIENLEIQPEANAEDILAQIYFTIDQFISPRLLPRTFEELIAEGYSLPEIYEGPLFESGFVLPDMLIEQLEDRIYTSDLISLIMKQAGVIGVNGLTLDHYLDRFKTATGVRNCLKLRNPKLYKPKLSFYDSEITVNKRGVVLRPNLAKVEQGYRDLKKEYLESFSQGNLSNLPAPEIGEPFDIKTFYSIQNEFPEAYGLREGEISPSAPPLRKAQAKQLKSYLLFFEQLLVNYCAQLDNIEQLFSINNFEERTYFFQSLYNVPAVKDLIKPFVDQAEQDWPSFQESCNAYIKHLDLNSESRTTFIQRRNQFLDHLLARVGEDFGTYAAWAYVQNGNALPSDLIFDKLSFLQNFPELSSRRAVAFNYTTDNLWDTENVSGFEKRVAAQLGVPDFRRRSLATVFNIRDYIDPLRGDDEQEEARLKLLNVPVDEADASPAEAKVLLTSTQQFLVGSQIEQAKERFLRLAQQGKNYRLVPTDPTQSSTCRYNFQLWDEDPEVEGPFARRSGNFTNRAKVEEAIREIIHLIQGRATEGMHLVEHILLRPISGSTESLDTTKLSDANDRPLIPDPYAFQVSIFLPGWTPRFKDPEFRSIVESKLREGLPAHLFPWIYWVELDEQRKPPQEFIAFETAYQQWLENLHTENRAEMQDAFIRAFNELISSNRVTLMSKYKAFEL